MSKKPRTPAVINDDYSYVSGADGQTYTMTLKERDFCDKYLEFRGNGTTAMMQAYALTNPKIAASMAYEYLRKPHLLAYINDKLIEAGFNDENVEKQHLFLVNQHADLKSKAKGIDMFYQLKGKYAPTKSLNVNANVNVDTRSPEAQEIAKKYEEDLLKQLMKTKE